jgi:histidine ammonia-lyase
LRCPFGCRQAHHKKNSIKRSVEYYRSEEGKIKKKALNERRGQSTSKSEQVSNESVHNEVTVHYIQTLIGLIEGRWVSMDEVLVMLKNILRQHSIGKGKRFVYAFQYSRGGP